MEYTCDIIHQTIHDVIPKFKIHYDIHDIVPQMRNGSLWLTSSFISYGGFLSDGGYTQIILAHRIFPYKPPPVIGDPPIYENRHI